jgi:polysaccharide pyruvyl transferase WcaK-like protein
MPLLTTSELEIEAPALSADGTGGCHHHRPGHEMRIVAPFGFYGWGNIGDEATLQGFAQLLKLRGLGESVWVASRNPTHTARVEPSLRYFSTGQGGLRDRLTRRWVQNRASAVVFAGGTPIMDGLGEWPLSVVAPLVRGARETHRPVVFVGVGTEKLHRLDSRRMFADELAPTVVHWSVRSDRDKERLDSWGVAVDRISVSADMAWLLSPQSTEFGERTLRELNLFSKEPLIGVNVNNEPVVLKEEPKLFEKLAAFLDTMVETAGARILFLCSEVRDEPTFDKMTAERVLGLMHRTGQAALLPNRYWTPQELLSLLACCRTVVSMRYHVCLFSALQGVPFLAIQRSDKVRDLCSDIEWPFGLPLGSVEVPALLDQVHALEAQRSGLTDHLRQSAAERRLASLKNQVALDALNDSVRPSKGLAWLQ